MQRNGKQSRNRFRSGSLTFSTLEQRRLLAVSAGSFSPDLVDVQTINQDWNVGVSSKEAVEHVTLQLPAGLPDSFTVPVEFEGEQLTLSLQKNSIFGPNTKFLVENEKGELEQIPLGEDPSYLGTVEEAPWLSVSALLIDGGLHANIIRPNARSIIVKPIVSRTDTSLHKIYLDEATEEHQHANLDGHNHDELSFANESNDAHFQKYGHHLHDHSQVSGEQLHQQDDIGNGHDPDCGCPDCLCAGSESERPDTRLTETPNSKDEANSTRNEASSRSNPAVNVLVFEIGVEIGSRAFEASSAYNSNLATAQASAMSIIGNMDARYLHGAQLKHRLGTVIIRTNAATDPLRNSVTGTGTNGSAGSSLAAFRDYWNNNVGEVGNTHDVAIYHVLSAPSGLAYVNSIGSSNRYATSGGNGATSWADGTAVHELGHSWNLAHVNDGQFYESKPRNNSGSNVAGGEEVFISVMHGGGDHNIGRLATSEAERVIAAKNNRSSFGDALTSTVAIKPFGKHDTAFADLDPVVLDVLANDYDSNNDVLELQLLDTVSQMGGVISISVGTSPSGGDELIYTPPEGGASSDFFHYRVVDSTGRSDFGAVNISGSAVVDLTLTSYLYDLGTTDSPVFSDYSAISDQTLGQLGFTTDGPNPIESRDRGSIAGVNDLNRDHIRMRSPSAFHHSLAPGVYDILFTIGDAIETTGPIEITAEETDSLTTQTHAAGNFTNYILNNVTVTDGELNVDIENLGFSSNISRLNITKVAEILTVDTSQTSFFYDLGALDSALFNQSTDTYVRLSHNVSGDVSFVGGNPDSFDRGAASGVNDINRDGIIASGSTTLNHRIANGVWRVVVNIGDRDFVRDDIDIVAEGITLASDIDRQAAEFGPTLSFNVAITDGELNLQFNDSGGLNNDISVTRVNLIQISEFIDVDLADTSYFYDFGALDSVLFTDNSDPYVRLAHNVGGDVSFTGGNPTSFDRGTTAGVNDINRDGIVATGSTTFNHVLPNGIWQILVSIGDRDFTRDDITVTAEGQIFATDVDRDPAQFGPNIIFNVEVTDGELNLEFDDAGGVNDDISLTRLVMTQLPDVASIDVNSGEAQRSVVDELVVTFAGLVDLDSDVFSVLQRGDLGGKTCSVVDTSYTTEVIDGNTVATIVFDSLTRGNTGALVDGNYELTIDNTKVRRAGTNVAMAEDFVFGDNESDQFFTLYGSSNGARTINIFNLLDFRQSYLASTGDTDFNAAFDFDGNGTINVFDLLAFRQSFRKTLQFS